MHPAIKSEGPEMIKADANCTIDYLINKSKTKKHWTQTCVKTSTDFENFVAPIPNRFQRKKVLITSLKIILCYSEF